MVSTAGTNSALSLRVTGKGQRFAPARKTGAPQDTVWERSNEDPDGWRQTPSPQYTRERVTLGMGGDLEVPSRR